MAPSSVGLEKKSSVLNHQFNAGAVHVYHAAGADIEMSDFAVAHLPVGQPDRVPAGLNQRVGIFPQQTVIGWLACAARWH